MCFQCCGAAPIRLQIEVLPWIMPQTPTEYMPSRYKAPAIDHTGQHVLLSAHHVKKSKNLFMTRLLSGKTCYTLREIQTRLRKDIP